MKTAIITGITGQDGSYLADFLLKNNYKVFGLVRRTSLDPMERLDYLGIKNDINFLYSDLSESFKIGHYIRKIQPSLLFNLGAQSFVTYSYDNPMYTDRINNFGVLNLLENKCPPLVSPNISRDLIYVDDVVDFYMKVAQKRKINGEIFNIGSGKKNTIKQIFYKVRKIMQCNVKPKWSTMINRSWDQEIWFSDMSKANRLLKYN